MKITITYHAKERMIRYNVTEGLIIETIKNPDNILERYAERKIYQKKLDGYILRVIVQEKKGIKIIITVYKAKSGRYGI